MDQWSDKQPIYRQLRDRVVAMILDGTLKDGQTLPSVRTIAAEYRVNPITVLKGFQELVDEGLVEVRRGIGMFVTSGARNNLMSAERQRFLAEEWPEIHAKILRLELSPKDLLATEAPASSTDGKTAKTTKSNPRGQEK